MTEQELQSLAERLSHHLGLRFQAYDGHNGIGETVEFRLSDVDHSEGFTIHVQLGWRSLELAFLPGNFAAQLVSAMGEASGPAKAAFAALAQQVFASGAVMTFLVNGERQNPTETSHWPAVWTGLQLTIRKAPIELGAVGQAYEAVRTWSVLFGSLTLALLPVEEVEASAEDVTGYPEGALTTVQVNRYERDRRNRALCLQAKGYRCCACGFDFGSTYGELGQEFIHVHHVTPVSEIGAGYIINPITDLIPICPNCHAMVHRRIPPMSVEELRAVLARSVNA